MNNDINENKDIGTSEIDNSTEPKNKKRTVIRTIYRITMDILPSLVIVALSLNCFKFIGILNDNKKLIQASNFIRENYYGENLSTEEIDELMINGMVMGLPDKYSTYQSPEDAKNFFDRMNGTNTGIGIIFKNNKIIEVKDGSPAENSGIKVGDTISSINGFKIIQEDNHEHDNPEEDTCALAYESLQNEDEITFILDRNGEKVDITTKKETFNVKLVDYEMLEDDIAFMKLTSFSEEMYEEFDKAIKLFESKSAKALIIDLRNNLGGKKDAMEYVADALIKDSIIGIEKQRDSSKNKVLKTDSAALDIPIVVLTNELSASCSEIFAGAIVSNDKGITIGTNTYGKGTVLGGISFEDGSIIYISVSEITLKDNSKIEGVGIKPTIKETDESKHIDLAKKYIKENILQQ